MVYQKNSNCMLVLTFCLVMLTGLPGSSMGSDDDYLSALSEEADTLETLGNARRELDKVKANVRKQNKGTAPKKVATVKGMRQMESELQQDFPASFQLYQQLDGNAKQQVFGEYSSGKGKSHNARIFSAINKIIILQVK